jgi:xanthine/uracil permease
VYFDTLGRRAFMRPLTVLLAIVAGSALALAVCLAMTEVVFMLMPEYAARLAGERAPLWHALVISWLMAAVAGSAVYGEIRQRSWRRLPQWLVLAGMALLAWRYWPGRPG